MATGWTDSTAYKRLQTELAVRTADDFERAALRLLRLIWPGALGTPRRRKFDRAGADHLVWSDAPPFPVVVQCKGWEVSEDELGRSQIDQCLASIDSFRRGGLTAERYILAHNRTGKNRAFSEAVEAALAGLVESGLAQSAELWSRQRIAQEAFSAVYGRYLTELPRFNLNRFDLFKQIEHTYWEPLERVPITSRVIKVDQYRLVESGADERKVDDPCHELVNARETLAILLGPAGFGKSTTAFRLAQKGTRHAIYVPAATITKSVRTTSDLLKQAVSLEELLKESEPEDYETHETVAREVLARILKREDAPLLLVLDGLDESVFFNERGGLQRLMNLIKEDVSIPVVMTARSEYWRRKEVDFATSFDIQGTKGPRKVKPVRLVELGEWGEAEMLELMRRVRSEMPPGEEESGRLGELERLISSGSYSDFYGDIPRRPLFLRFIIETVRERAPHRVDRPQLVQEWAVQKILRDIGNPQQFGGRRAPIASEADAQTTIELAFLAMKHAAVLMTRVAGGVVELLPSCRFDALASAHPRLGAMSEPTGVMLNSLLVPISVPAGDASRLGFAHRLFQEFFLGLAISEGILDIKGLTVPESVGEWIR
jgi:hypothetical protein